MEIQRRTQEETLRGDPQALITGALAGSYGVIRKVRLPEITTEGGGHGGDDT